MAYTHDDPEVKEVQPPGEGVVCLHAAVHMRVDDTECDPTKCVAINPVSMSGHQDEHDNIVLQAVFVIPKKEIP